ncbi:MULTISPECIES: fasciclin domain-containing protein [Mycolicibacterium]|uniref:fasciclin domain-containing protein n=1 Tax=Mycolicibacterium TaxID=1866885 RepID=UPI001268A992|nr:MULTISPECIES: fasciclin domain-containing protein [Mycolicibacterium]MCG7583144.1 fasciclin domain-containing protein [Mycolicibacterium sp. OfavD-34-C]MCK5751276.1 fasciclin domain-containing protein [Mycobacterium sp.]MCV7265496.1 fasciclin domain-containing protein [Mycolicibacterium poriferae]QFS91296.1 Cell surface lipoprotein MPB83 precursor [Mycobacterium sp. THAF192]
MITVNRKSVAAVGVAAAAMLGVAACSSDSSTEATDATTTTTSAAAETTTSMAPTTSAMADPAANLIGSGCAAYAEQVPTGPGSVTGMASAPVTVAASNNPMLTTLTQALSGQLNPDVNLVETLDGGEFTVFAPTDDAFAKLDPATIETLKTDSDLLTSILTYHVVPGQAAPDQVPGEHETVQGATLNVTGEGDDLMVNDAGLVCGGVKTSNAVVYMIDTVLMPPAS